MVNQLHVKLIKVDLKRKDYDLVSFDLIYHLLVDYEYCSWTVSKLKSDFLKLNQVLPEEFSGDFSATFPFWGIRPTDAKLAKHEEFVAKYVAFLDSISSSATVEEFLNLEQHDVLRVALDVLKDHRGNNESEVEVWDMLNSCDEDLILTEKQLHSINLCSEPPEDLQIPFLELRRAIDSVANVKVIGNGFDDSHKYKPSPNLDMSHFQSVTSITLENIDFKGVTELGNLSENLRHLTIKAGIQDIQEILIWVTEADIEPVAWNALETLNLSYNSIEIMDESLQLLIQLSTLDLSYNIISSIENIQGLPYLRELDLSHNNISDTDALHMKMGNITNLNLSHNKIQLLYGFERLFSLEELDLSHNCVEQLNEVNRLSNLPQLENLSLLGNPISKKSAYRPTVLTVFYENEAFRLDREPTTPAERKKLKKTLEKTKEVEVKLEESICVVEILEESYDKAFLEESQECDEQYVTFSELNINETHLPSNKRCLTSLASISELDESFDDDTLTNSWLRERAPTIVEVEKMVMFDGDNWLANFMDDIDKDHFERPPTPPPTILKMSEETLKSLEPTPPKKQRKMPEKTEAPTAESSGSCETESSKGSKDSKSNEAIIRQPSVPFHIVPNEVYNIDEKIEDLVNRYSSLSFHELQPNFSVYRDNELYVMALLPSSPYRPHLVEVKPRGGKMTWSLYSVDIESCDLIGDQISIKKFDEETPRVYSQLFLHDTAHLYLLVTKMKDIREPEPPEELNKLASDRIVVAAVEDALNEEFYSFPSHCFRYCKADVPLPVVLAITQSEVLVIKIENQDLLHLNQDILAQILTDESCTFSILHREKMSSIRQVLMSYFEHTVRIEFKEDGNPYGSPETTISLIGYNSQDIEMFLETLASRLDTQNIPPSDIIFTEEDTDIRLLKRVLRIQDLQKINCVSVRIMETCYFRCLVMTDNFLYVLEEDFVRWPPPCFVRHPPLTPRYSVVQQIRIRFIQGITLFAEIHRGSYVLSMGYYKNLKTFERGRVDLFISSYENREQIVGHIKRTWEQYYKKEIIVSSMKRYEVEEENSGGGGEGSYTECCGVYCRQLPQYSCGEDTEVHRRRTE
ncbi:uncharacterized protein LOC134819736 isoform X2 [Bolinopsis microptera]|uniref:uncharacterized protein LOC134819736 isoform X2 n=1 Tax=Bolinopsis microptera TaxID=2820187 RepID=UPI003078B9E0